MVVIFDLTVVKFARHQHADLFGLGWLVKPPRPICQPCNFIFRKEEQHEA